MARTKNGFLPASKRYGNRTFATGTYIGTRIAYQDGNASNFNGAPIDFGSSDDPGAVEAPPPSYTIDEAGVGPAVTDPGRGEGGDEAASGSNARLDMAGSLIDRGNPLDPSAGPGPSGDAPTTGEADRNA